MFFKHIGHVYFIKYMYHMLHCRSGFVCLFYGCFLFFLFFWFLGVFFRLKDNW